MANKMLTQAEFGKACADMAESMNAEAERLGLTPQEFQEAFAEFAAAMGGFPPYQRKEARHG